MKETSSVLEINLKENKKKVNFPIIDYGNGLVTYASITPPKIKQNRQI